MGATAAVLIRSAAAELQRQKQEELSRGSEEGIESGGLTAGEGEVDEAAAKLEADLSRSFVLRRPAAPTPIATAFNSDGSVREEKTSTPQEMYEGLDTAHGESEGVEGGTASVVTPEITGKPISRSSSVDTPGGNGSDTDGGFKKPSIVVSRKGSDRWREGISGLGGWGSGLGAGLVSGPGGSGDGSEGWKGVQCFTCTVGKKPSRARTYVNDIDEVGGSCVCVCLSA